MNQRPHWHKNMVVKWPKDTMRKTFYPLTYQICVSGYNRDMENTKHRKVQVVVIGGEELNQLLLLQTKKDRDEHWQNVTGSVDEGETFYSAAQRELEEETGIQSELIELNLQFEFRDRWGKDVIEKVFLAKAHESVEVKISEEEHQDFKWVYLNDLTKESFGFESNWKSYTTARDWIEDNN